MPEKKCNLSATISPSKEYFSADRSVKGQDCPTSESKHLLLLSLKPDTQHERDPLPKVIATKEHVTQSRHRSLWASVASFCVALILSFFMVVLHKPDSAASKTDDEVEERLMDGNASSKQEDSA